MAQEKQTITKLKEVKFSALSLQEKVAIKRRGRPLPEVQISQSGISKNKKYIRSFNSEWYQKKKWLCGCEVTNALFCFPCVLFGGDSTWSRDGFTNINKMKEKTEKHEHSKKHIGNVVSLSLLGTVSSKATLSEAHKLSVNEHNRKVAKNREILSKIIDCIKFCGNFDVPFRGRELDEAGDSVNPCVFRTLIDFASKLDPDLRNHLETNAVFKGVPKGIQDDVLDCLLQVYYDHVKKEIEDASFVAVMAGDATDVSERAQTIVIVLRYLVNEEIVERFWGVFTPEDHTADGLAKCILAQLDLILDGNSEKLIAQTFDGASFVKCRKGDVQAKIKSVYNNAHFVHCYAHQVDLMLEDVASVTRSSRLFFSNFSGMAAFFSRSPLPSSILNKHMISRIQPPSTTRWNFQINSIYENFEPIKNCIEELQKTSNVSTTVAEATGILSTLNSEHFRFWLQLFQQIMPHAEVVHNQMQSRGIDESKAREYVANFKSAILEIKNSSSCKNPTQTIMAEAEEVCDCVCADIAERYSFTKHLVAAKLFNKESFVHFKKKGAVEEIGAATEAYPMINKERLETELNVFYSRSDMHKYGKLTDLLKLIVGNDLADVLGEMTKLIQILLTIPMATSEPERCFSTLKRVKTVFSSSVNQEERLNALSVISIEKTFMNGASGINEKVIDLFAVNENRRVDFVFK